MSWWCTGWGNPAERDDSGGGEPVCGGAERETALAPPSIVVPAGSATGQTGIDRGMGRRRGVAWVEFSGIPAARIRRRLIRFTGSRALRENLRFVDNHWNDLLSRDWPHVGQPPNVWLDGLLGRLIRKDRHGPPRVPQWIWRR